MVVKTAYTKRGDTEVLFQLNTTLSTGSVKAFVKDENGNKSEVPATISNASGIVSVNTSALPVGKYSIEVQVTTGSTIATYPDSGYVKLIVIDDLGT